MGEFVDATRMHIRRATTVGQADDPEAEHTRFIKASRDNRRPARKRA